MFWRAEDINFDEDSKEFKEMKIEERNMFEELLRAQLAWTSPDILFVDYISLIKQQSNYSLDSIREKLDKLDMKFAHHPFEFPGDYVDCNVQMALADDIILTKLKDRESIK